MDTETTSSIQRTYLRVHVYYLLLEQQLGEHCITNGGTAQ